MSVWTLDGDLCDMKSCTLGLEGADSAVVELRPGMAAAPTTGAWVTLACDGQPILYGQVRAGRSIQGAAEVTEVVIEGPWALMDRVVYQQPQAVWVEDELATQLSPEVQLGVADNGTRRTTAQEVAAIVTYAQGAGVPITLDSSFTGRTIPVMAFEGVTCGRAILALMEHHPDVVVWIDYSAGTAVLTLTPLSGLATETIAQSSGGVTGANFREILDYKPAGVRILYTRVGPTGRVETFEDSAGSVGTDGKAPDVINWLVPLEGNDPAPVEEQEIKTRPIPEDGASQTTLRNYFKKHLPWLTDAIAESITISNLTRTIAPPADGLDEDPSAEVEEEDYSTDPDDYPRELVSGGIRPWMGKESAPMTVRADFSYSGTGTLPAGLAKVFGPSGTITREFYTQITATDASTRVYRALAESLTVPSFPSAGLAAAYMATFPAAVWEGSVTKTGAAQPIYRPGIKLNVTGFESAWASMAAMVKSVSFDSLGHAVTVTVGAPAGLDFGDFFAAQRLLKKRRLLSDGAAAARRTQAQRSGGKTRGQTRPANRASATSDGGSGSALARPLQVQLRKVGSNWNIGITPGTFQGIFGSEAPVMQPSEEVMDSAPVYWFDEDLTAMDETDNRGIWAKFLIDDSDPYELKTEGVEMHLLEEPPDPIFSLSDYQWLHVATCFADGDGTMLATAELSGSVWCHRQGGPGSGLIFTPL